MKEALTPIILAGGIGSRIWPLSKSEYPKQFVHLASGFSLFQLTIRRLKLMQGIDFNKPLILTKEDYRFIVKQQLGEIGITNADIILEPEAKNTAPSFLLAVLYSIGKNYKEFIVFPSDHYLSSVSYLQKSIKIGQRALSDENIITFGIKPTRPETGYGYIESGSKTKYKTYEVKKFIEKPSLTRAKKLSKEKKYYWNSGMFLFRANSIISAFKKYYPSLLAPVKKSLNNSIQDMDFIKICPSSWKNCKSISFDYAVMEKNNYTYMIPYNSKWEDLGDWNSVNRNIKKFNYNANKSIQLESSHTDLHSMDGAQTIVGIGLENILAVSTKNSLLIANKNNLQNMRDITKTLEKHKKKFNYEDNTVYRPWGYFDVVYRGHNYLIKNYYKSSFINKFTKT